MTHSTRTAKIAAALVAFQDGLRPVARNAVGSDGKRFTDLGGVRAHVARRLVKHCLAVVQFAGWDKVETVILHVSGEWLAHETSAMSVNGDQSYGPRHALMMALGVVQEPENAPDIRTARCDVVATTIPPQHVEYVLELMHELKLNEGQQRVLLQKHVNPQALRAEAEKMAGVK